jgi:hypothetical protein
MQDATAPVDHNDSNCVASLTKGVTGNDGESSIGQLVWKECMN